jgi:hypothetical protein
MNTNRFFSAICGTAMIIAGCFLTGCQKEDLVYSCDPEEDAIVKENIVEIRKMSSTEWFSVSENYKRPVFRAFTPKQRLNLWITKLDETLESFQWSKLEYDHITLLKDYLVTHSEIFATTDTLVRTNCRNFQVQWVAYAQNSLKWTQQQILSIAYSANRVISRDGDLLYNETSQSQIFTVDGEHLPTTVRLKNGAENADDQGKTCSCNIEDDYCPFPGGCVDRGCDKLTWGCGFMLLYACDGKCHLY